MRTTSEEELLPGLLKRDLALTTFEKTDFDAASRLRTALVRGEDELMLWGMGPSLTSGDLAALYVTDTKYLPRGMRKCVAAVYVVAAALPAPELRWNYVVFLYRRITLDQPLTLQDLEETVNLRWRDIRGLGMKTEPLQKAEAERFWLRVFRKNPHLCARVRERLRLPQVAISYAGEDWEYADRLRLWCKDEEVSAFFVTSTGSLEEIGEAPLEGLLEDAFTQARVRVVYLPSREATSDWTKLELKTSLARPQDTVLVRIGRQRPVPRRLPRGVACIDFTSAGEREVAPAMEEEIMKVVRRRLRTKATC